MRKNLIIFLIVLIVAFLCAGAVSASCVTDKSVKKIVNSTPKIIDKGIYKWTDSKGHKCYYTWKDYKYSSRSVLVIYTYKHQTKYFTGMIKLINKQSQSYNNDIYFVSTGNMWKTPFKGYYNGNRYASTYALTQLYLINRKGSLIRYFVHPTAPALDKRDDWEVKSVTVKRLTIMYPTHEIYYGSFFDITINYGRYTRAYNPNLSGLNYIHLYLVKSTSVPVLTNYRKYPNAPRVYYPDLGHYMTYYEATNKQLTHTITFTCPLVHGLSGLSWTPPSGWYRVAAIIDRDGRDNEYDETNNVAFSAPFYYYTNPSNTGSYWGATPT